MSGNKEKNGSGRRKLFVYGGIGFGLLLLILGALYGYQKYRAKNTHEWILFNASKGIGDLYYDRNAVVDVGQKRIRTLIKIKFEESQKQRLIQLRSRGNLSTVGWDKVDYLLDFIELDCINRTTTEITTSIYDLQGKILEEDMHPVRRRDPIEPGSRGESLLNIVCRP